MTGVQSAHPVTMAIVHAMRRALWVWFGALMLAVAALGLAIVLVIAGGSGEMAPPLSPWFIASALMLGLVMPVCVMTHWRMFRRNWHDGVVDPGAYLRASLVLWGGLTATALVIAVGAIQRGTLIPDLLLAAPALALLMLSWPNGWAMTHARRRRDEDDDEILHFQRPDA